MPCAGVCGLSPSRASRTGRGPLPAPVRRARLARACRVGRPGARGGRRWRPGRRRPGRRGPSASTTWCWRRSWRAGAVAPGSRCPLGSAVLPGRTGRSDGCLSALSPSQVLSFVLVETAPDPVLVRFGRVVEAVVTDWADAADSSGLCTRISVGWEEGVRVLAGAQSAAVPFAGCGGCLLYTSDAADDLLCVDLGGRRIIKKKK